MEGGEAVRPAAPTQRNEQAGHAHALSLLLLLSSSSPLLPSRGAEAKGKQRRLRDFRGTPTPPPSSSSSSSSPHPPPPPITHILGFPPPPPPHLPVPHPPTAAAAFEGVYPSIPAYPPTTPLPVSRCLWSGDRSLVPRRRRRLVSVGGGALCCSVIWRRDSPRRGRGLVLLIGGSWGFRFGREIEVVVVVYRGALVFSAIGLDWDP
ncbi:hypothetical protein DAI22_04g175933 [Oryza sativa Japonica Group]|nr:hypothetical protein DAI22_04g175933 [Oryza sativa Japonica Group]